MKIQPTEDRVLIEPIQEPDKTAGGLHVPESAKVPPRRGTLIRVGPGRYLENGMLIAVPLAIGTVVLFPEQAGTEVVEGDKRYLMLRAGDIHGFEEEE